MLTKKIAFLAIPFILIALPLISQTDTVFNQTDAKGLKQGHWKKTYLKGTIKYQGTFKNNKPVGKMTRYYESGEIQAILMFSDNSETTYAKLYYEDGERSAEGKYVKMQKDSIWKYYSYYTGSLVSEEEYVKGKKHGLQKSYYSNGQVSEETEYKSNFKDGIWKQYFEDGKPKLIASNKQNTVHGRYTFYYPSGVIMMLGMFENNKKNGSWIYNNEDGKEKYTVRYVLGKINSEDEMKIIKQDEEYFEMIEKNMGKFENPTIEDLYRGPQ